MKFLVKVAKWFVRFRPVKIRDFFPQKQCVQPKRSKHELLRLWEIYIVSAWPLSFSKLLRC